ncbi:MAG TPA: oxidoreductase [Gammaproteobacteria bacterium]|nr:oxidoreductase [Gammaproteobacteria bacterium]
MESYGYAAPSSVSEAISTIKASAAAGRMIQVLAGGTDVMVQMKALGHEARTLIDIKKLSETNRLEVGADEIYIGAAVPSALMNEDAQFKALLPGLAEAADLIGSTQIQGRATICGNLCNASPAGDSIPAMIAAGAVCDIATADGRRELPVEDFVVGVGKNALQEGEILLGLKIPTPQANSKDAYLRFTPRTEMDIAVAGVGVSLTVVSGTCTAARVAIGAVAPTALLVADAASALIGTQLDEAALAAAADACRAAASPITDKRGTADYRKTVVGVLCKRAIALAHSRI